MHQELIVLCGLIIKAVFGISFYFIDIVYNEQLVTYYISLIIIRSIETAFVFVCIVEFKPQTKKKKLVANFDDNSIQI